MSEDTEVIIIYSKKYTVVEWDMKEFGNEYVVWQLFSYPSEDDDG